MRIGLVLDCFDPSRGGVEQWTFGFARWLVKSGHEVHVVARSIADSVEQLGVITHPVDAPRSRLALAAVIENRLRQLRLDVVHDTGTGWFADVFQPHGGSRFAAQQQNLQLLPRGMRRPKQWAARWLPRYREFSKLAARQYGNQQCLYLPLSRMVADDMQRFHGIRSEQMRIVYNGVDTERFAPDVDDQHRTKIRHQLGIADHEVLLLIVAHNHRLKGVPALVKATERLHAEGCAVRTVVVGGKVPHRVAHSSGLNGACPLVQFLGSIDDPRPYYAAADVYVQPTFYDPCSLVVLEAFASGLPVVTSRFNGAGELITPGVEGQIIDDPADVEELATAIAGLCDEAVRRQAAAAARRLALKHTAQRNAQEIMEAYETALDSSRAAA